MISIGSDGRVYVNWTQNGIRNKRAFRSEKEADRFQELVDDLQNSMKLCEEMDRFKRDFNYDPAFVNLKVEHVGKEIQKLKESIKIKHGLQKKLGLAVQKLAEQPRNAIGRDEFVKAVKEIKSEIDRLDRFFKEHSVVSLHKSLQESVKEMKTYYAYQKEAVKRVEDLFKDIKKEIVQKFSSITIKDKVLSINEIMQHLGISYSTVQSMIFEHGLLYFRIGNRYRIKENDLNRWIEKHKGRREVC